jgi:hypothetical protein
MTQKLCELKNPARVAAGRVNRAKRRGYTPEGLERVRQAALRNKPWLHSTGPKTAAGKAKSAKNRRRRPGLRSVIRALREMRALARLPALAFQQILAERLSEPSLQKPVGEPV